MGKPIGNSDWVTDFNLDPKLLDYKVECDTSSCSNEASLWAMHRCCNELVLFCHDCASKLFDNLHKLYSANKNIQCKSCGKFSSPRSFLYRPVRL